MRYAVLVLFTSASLLLGACASQPAAVAVGTSETAPGVAGAPGAPVSVNPYLQGREAVPPAVQRQFDQARVLIEAQEWQGAVLELQALTQAHPELSGASLNLALVYQQTGDTEQAQHWFQQSIEANPHNIAAYNEYGIFLRKQGHFEEAELVYLKALEQWEESADSHRDIGILYDLYLGDSDKALQHYRRYQALTGAQDRAVAGWISDLERRTPSIAKGEEP
ncbi:MAG: tetratricopeptide repeat protein [Halioglobus sp.]